MNTTNSTNIEPKQLLQKRGVPRPTDKYPRQDPDIPLEVSSEMLTNPKGKSSASFRKTMLRSRGRIIILPVANQKPYAVKVEAFAKSRNAKQLCACLRRLPARIRALEREKARLEGKQDFRFLQRKNAIELSLLDAQKHLTALQHEASRRIQPRA